MSHDHIGARTDEEWERMQERERMQELISEVARLRKEVEELRGMMWCPRCQTRSFVGSDKGLTAIREVTKEVWATINEVNEGSEER